MISRIAVYQKVPDTRAVVRQKNFSGNFHLGKKIQSITLVDVYTVSKNLQDSQLEALGNTLINPVTEYAKIRFKDENIGTEGEIYVNGDNIQKPKFDWAIEIGFLPGVTDNIGKTTKQMIEDHLKIKFSDDEGVYSSQVTLIEGDLSEEEIKNIAASLYNPLIQRVHIKSLEEYKKIGGMDYVAPKVTISGEKKVSEIDLNVVDEELEKIGKEGVLGEDGIRRGPLALNIDYMRTIRDYFAKQKRNPTDIELETLAQTWSEHCKHTIFADPLDDIKDGLYKTYIKAATAKVKSEKLKVKSTKNFIVKVFNDNSGAIEFDKDFLITHKVETHNTPSALDPFGGAITGIVGVNRDALGFGLGAKPVFNTYGFFFADPDDKKQIFKDAELTQAMLSPKRIMEGVIAGVNAGGNQSGIPTPVGFMYFDDRYKGKPLVFCGTVGLIPKKIGDRKSWEKAAKPGDYVVMVGGKVGLDGIHGATFSSETLHSGSPSTAVQIGDPITQKKFSDAIAKEARDLNLYNSITDNGAGGLSSSVGEMARESGGVLIDLEKVPLKYPGLDPWQIWISESQERMTLAVPQNKWEEFEKLMNSRGVEAWVIGEFTKSKKCVVRFNSKVIMDLDLEFLHDGLPERLQRSEFTQNKFKEPKLIDETDLTKVFNRIMGRLNISGYEFLSTQYDHTVQGTAVTSPTQGRGRVNAEAAVVRPLYDSDKGIALSQGMFPAYSEIDPYDAVKDSRLSGAYKMAAASMDAAFKNAVIAGANPEKIALLDNFCWCSSDEAERLYQLKKACEGVYDLSVAYLAPLISGKDSMFNDFKGFDDKGNPIKISIPPTLLISSIGIVEDVNKAVTIDAKFAGDLIYVLGETFEELGGSEYFDMLGNSGNTVPATDPEKNLKIYKAYSRALDEGIIASAIGVGHGGLAVALAKMAIAGKLGIEVSLKDLVGKVDHDQKALFSESTGRILLTINPEEKQKFESLMKGIKFAKIGEVSRIDAIKIKGLSGKEIVSVKVGEVLENYRKEFKDW